jgi:predicted TIM-barrel fold metal-dependent hydrolase
MVYGKTGLPGCCPGKEIRYAMSMIIDIHTHITYTNFPEFSRTFLDRPPFTVDVLLKRMDLEGIDKSVLLPLNNPDVVDYYGVAGNQECIEAARRHPDRLIAFCNIDPRSMMNHTDTGIAKLMRLYRELGCKGIGEVCAGLPMDDVLYQRLFFNAGEEGLPLIFHFKRPGSNSYGAIDEVHLPRTEQMLKMFPKTIFAGHSPGFWNEIAADEADAASGKGRLWELFDKYPNVYGDCSAGSGHRALSRHPAMGYEFLEKYHTRVFFGTDRFTSLDEPIPPILPFLKGAVAEGKISRKAYECIMSGNFNRVVMGASG